MAILDRDGEGDLLNMTGPSLESHQKKEGGKNDGKVIWGKKDALGGKRTSHTKKV